LSLNADTAVDLYVTFKFLLRLRALHVMDIWAHFKYLLVRETMIHDQMLTCTPLT